MPSDLYTYINDSPAAWTLSVNGNKVKPKMDKGYAVIDRKWQDGDVVELNLPMEVRRVVAIVMQGCDDIGLIRQ